MDPNEPFLRDAPFVPGGILATYKKRLNLTADEIMEQDYWNQMKDFSDTSAKYFEVVSKDEQDLMTNTKNYATRLRLKREIDFTEDFRKRFMTRDYGNYEKYEKNKIEEEVERGENDTGLDTLLKNNYNLMKNLKTQQGVEEKEHENENLQDLLTNEEYADQTITDRFSVFKLQNEHLDEVQ